MIKIAVLTTDNREQLRRYDVPEPFFGTATSALLDGFAMLPQEIEVHVISCAKNPMRKPEKIAPNIWFHQPIVHKLGWGRSAFVGCGLAVRKVLSTITPDLVHAQGTERDCAVSMMLAPAMPKVLTIHGHMARVAEISGARFPSYYWMAKNLEALAVRKADGVVALTRYTEQRVAANAHKTWVIPNAVDEKFLQVRNTPERGLILCVAHVHVWKQQVELMEALDVLPAPEKPRLVFLGEATDSTYGQRFLAAVAARSSWCEHAGNVDRAGLRDWLGRADLLVLPSIEDNCPMVALEAMAAGVPVVASDIGGIPDLVLPGVSGERFNPREPAEIAKKIRKLLIDRERRDNLAASAKAHALASYHPRTIAEKHLTIYREIKQFAKIG